MNKRLVIAAALSLLVSPAFAAPPSDAQLSEFYKQCMRNSGDNTTLCTCKKEQLPKLVDAEFMTIVLSTMEGKALPIEQSKPYGLYISKSNAICAPGM